MSETPTTGIVGIYQIATGLSTDYSVSLKGCRNKCLTHCDVHVERNLNKKIFNTLDCLLEAASAQFDSCHSI